MTIAETAGLVTGPRRAGRARVECRAGTRRHLGRGSMIPLARLPYLASAAWAPAHSSSSPPRERGGARLMSFGATPDRTATTENDFGG